MIIWGMAKNGHDWAITVFNDKELVASYTGKGKTHELSYVAKAREYGHPDLVVWYENPYLKSLRQFIAGQPKAFSRNNIKKYLRSLNIFCDWTYVSHHESHAAAYYNSDFRDATVVVIDSIGEFDCTTIWDANGDKLKKKISVRYPHSIGLFYSAMADRIGLQPQQDEGRLEWMGTTLGLPYRKELDAMEKDLIRAWSWPYRFKYNFHRGARQWRPEFKDDHAIATAAQETFKQLVSGVLWKARKVSKSKNIVISGGCAFNGAVKSLAIDWKNVYIPPNPGDGGSAEGAVLAYLNKNG